VQKTGCSNATEALTFTPQYWLIFGAKKATERMSQIVYLDGICGVCGLVLCEIGVKAKNAAIGQNGD
jgi:hypothetical protein